MIESANKVYRRLLKVKVHNYEDQIETDVTLKSMETSVIDAIEEAEHSGIEIVVAQFKPEQVAGLTNDTISSYFSFFKDYLLAKGYLNVVVHLKELKLTFEI